MPFFCSCISGEKDFLLPFELNEKNNGGFWQNIILFNVLDKVSDCSERVEISTVTKETGIMLIWTFLHYGRILETVISMLECFDGMVVTSVLN